MSRLRVVNLALPKTGTTTLTDALRQAGLTVADWKIRPGQSSRSDIPRQHLGKVIYEDYFASGDPLARLDEFDVINEMSAVRQDRSLWPQTDWGLISAIAAHHPGVRFILTTRDPAKAANSMMRWNNLGKRRLPQADIPGLPRGFGSTEAELARWMAGHYAFCRRVFAGAGNFMEYDIEDADAPEKIGSYLGLDLPWWGQSNMGKPQAQEADQMRLTLFIGPTEKAAMRLRGLFKEKEAPLAKQGIMAPDWNHVRLYAACAEAEEISSLRHKRGLDNPLVQQTLTAEFQSLLARELPEMKGNHVVLAAAQLGSLLSRPAELARLHDLLAPHFERIEIVAHLEEQARALTQHYNLAVLDGRRRDLGQELALAGQKDWWKGALALRGENDSYLAQFNDVQCPPFWLDYKALLAAWEKAFGKGRVTLRPLDLPALCSETGTAELEAVLGVKSLGKVQPDRIPLQEAAASLTRIRQMNEGLARYAQAKQIIIARDFCQQIRLAVRVGGPEIAPGSLHAISKHFKSANAALVKDFPDLKAALTPDAPAPDWQEADPTLGFRATQYLAAFAFGINKNATPMASKRAEAEAVEEAAEKFDELLPADSRDDAEQDANTRLLNRVKVNHQMVLSTQFRPHNNLGAVNEEELGAAYAPAPARVLKPGSTGNVIVGCMKNEAPYIVEWIAYHRAIGVDNFLIYTNDCSDGTDAVLGRLQEMGVIQHRNNDNWKGNSPQQYALNQAMKEPVIENAEWIIHIDVDEFMNVRTGNGTLEDFFAAVPDATNVAMTWRLFGHNGVTQLRDEFVIDQFDTCAPKYCPKPHTVWGFKTMFRNIGAYAKLSCHRPNKLAQPFEDKVKWVNGSGRDMTRDAAHNGWRSSKKNVGYDLLQLNHYALRSAESFLIKRQRGRALHVDRSIGINYWIRMDWSDFRDITIKRNIPRVRAEYERLMQDDILRAAHEAGFEWHKAKARELHGMPEFRDLYTQALEVKLNETERVAYALSLDMES